MNLTINWQQEIGAKSPFVNGLDSMKNVGKLNTVSKTEVSASVRTIEKTAVTSSTDNVQKISMDDMVSTLRANLMRVMPSATDGSKKDVEPLLSAFERTINQLNEYFGKPVADMAMGMIKQSVEQYGASESNLSNTLCNLFNKVASDGNLFEKHIKLNQKMYGSYADIKKGDWCADGLLELWNKGSYFLTDPDNKTYGIGAALSDFFGSRTIEQDHSYTMITDKFFDIKYHENANHNLTRSTAHVLLTNDSGGIKNSSETSFVKEKFMNFYSNLAGTDNYRLPNEQVPSEFSSVARKEMSEEELLQALEQRNKLLDALAKLDNTWASFLTSTDENGKRFYQNELNKIHLTIAEHHQYASGKVGEEIDQLTGGHNQAWRNKLKIEIEAYANSVLNAASSYGATIFSAIV